MAARSPRKRSLKREDRLRWFDRGAAVFDARFPAARAAAFGADAPPCYICPICCNAFTREDAKTGLLTAEDVPPASLGGSPLVLTCKPCNNAAGTRIDASARSRENIRALI